LLDALRPVIACALCAAMTTTRGIRNCNPGNIRKGAPWQGLSVDQPGVDFYTFQEPK
jgi:hypothetical protein